MVFFLPTDDDDEVFKLPGYLVTFLLAIVLYFSCRGAVTYYNHKRKIRQLTKLPGMKGHILLGALEEIPAPDESGLAFLRETLPHYPRMAYGFVGPFNMIVSISHPDPVKVILQTSEPKPCKFGGYHNALPWLGEGLLLSGGKKWARNRRLLTPAFHFDILRQYVAVDNSSADVLIDKWINTQGKYIEVFRDISLCTLEIILKCAFSYNDEIQKLGESHPYVKTVRELSQALVYRFLRPWLYPDLFFAFSQSGRRFSKNCRFVHSIADDIISRRQQTLYQKKAEEKENNKYLDFLDILLTAKDEQGQGLTDKEIRVEVDTFLFEGHDTTASGISWTLYSLAHNPDWQKKCQQEIDQILDGRDSDYILWEDLSNLKVLSACIKEGLRLHTPVPLIERQTTKDMYIDGYFIPSETQVDINIYNILHNPQVWDDPMTYNPNRFLLDKREKSNSFVFVPFSAGPRNCIGQNFAMHEMKIIIGRILRKFDITTDPDRPAKHEIPGPDERALRFLRETLPHYHRLAYGFIGPFNVMLMVNHPEPVKAILQTSEPKSLQFGAYKIALPWLGEGLLIAGGKKWSRNRRLLTPAFHFDILRQYVTVHNSSADVLIEKWTETKESYFEVFNHISLCTLETILRCAFSYDENIQKLGQSHPYVKAVQELGQDLVYRYLRPWLHSDLLFALSQTGRRFSKNCRFVHSIADNIIRRRRQTLKKNENKEKNKYLDFLDILLTAKDEQGQGLTDKEIRVEVDTFLFEGHDTTASGISWTLYSLAQNPEWQKRCQQEIDQILDGRDSDYILWEDLSNLKVLSACIKEGLRLHTPVPLIERQTTKDMYIDGYFIPSETQVDINIYNILHNPQVWDDPMTYNPNRFLLDKREKSNSFVFIPFSAGPRNCIGQNFAMHEMKIIIGKILRKFDITTDPDRPAKHEKQPIKSGKKPNIWNTLPSRLSFTGYKPMSESLAPKKLIDLQTLPHPFTPSRHVSRPSELQDDKSQTRSLK
ncbi:hypothetical protein LSH36_44g13010 [Paralvinella palmiformis]|uniref:Cytochrome P450 n=1 Tax=Paralvinella palmiformis TaxID=53620 RepID=A0AAD9NG59_9ANNE|nr:hypothetical protein LSH36_44g13010 [Paralvinella palmiformis]